MTTTSLKSAVTRKTPCARIGKKAHQADLFSTLEVEITICVDIAQDVMRLTADGQKPAVIRTYVDAAYSHIAPGTHTPLP